jgi:NADH-quinone oxidoreductase subunit D
MFDEITRILNHLMWLGAHALDVGAMTVFLYCFREREDLMDCYEAVSGARMHATYYRPGGVYRDLPERMPRFAEVKSKWHSKREIKRLNAPRGGSLLDFLEDFSARFPALVDEYETLLTDNRIWKKRTVDVGVVSPEQAVEWGLTGPPLRGSGIRWDIRKIFPYDRYDEIDFDIPIGNKGDTYDRYLVRMEEMRQSVRILRQCLDKLPDGPYMAKAPKILRSKEGMVYGSVEAPKGELGYFIVATEKGTAPYRCHVRPPSFVNLQVLPLMVEGRLVADLMAVIGTLDIVLGEIDR